MSTEVPEVALDLYAGPPETFVAARNELAKRLRADGDAATASLVEKLRRPTVAASAVNLVARVRGDLVGQILEAGAWLASTQRQLLSGRSTASASKELRDASDERRRLVRELADAAVDAASGDGRKVDHLRDEIAGTIEAATLDDELGERLRRGTVERSVTPSAGLTGVEGFAVIPGGAATDADDSAPDRASGPPDRGVAAERTAKEAKAARADADRATKAADRAAEKAERLARAAEEAERAARDARVEERRLRDEASTARRRAERAERSAKAAADRAAR